MLRRCSKGAKLKLRSPSIWFPSGSKTWPRMSPPAQAPGLDTFVEELETVAEELGRERFPLAGISQGWTMSIECSATLERVRPGHTGESLYLRHG